MSLFEDQTYENLLASALARISSTFDKREGSMVYNGVAPSMAELAQLYIGLDFVFTATYIATAPREYLIERAKDRGLSPKAASAAVFRAEFNIEVPVGTRFSCEELNFIVTERMTGKDTDAGLSHKVTCETAGSAANNCAGDLVPIEYIAGLASAGLVELLIPGDDEEETEVFRQRVLDTVQSQAFGGNQADYKAKVLGIDGVSAVKIYRVWNSDISPSEFIPSNAVINWMSNGMDGITNTAVKQWISALYAAAKEHKLTVGGCVRLVIAANGNTVPTQALIDKVQNALDPIQYTGEGMGLAPIGHVVKVEGVSSEIININTELTLLSEFTVDDVKPHIENVVDGYFNELAERWSQNESIIVRISQLESRILQECSSMIVDIANTKLNGENLNITLGADSIPVRGQINGQKVN